MTEGTNQGRIYYGFDEPVAGASPEAVFVPPTIDIPATVQLGQTWTRSLYWPTLYYEVILVSNYFTCCANVDAAGSMALPGIGTVQALRVHEVHSYTISEVTDPPILLDMHTNDYYYWLVPGVGVAVQVILYGNNVLYPGRYALHEYRPANVLCQLFHEFNRNRSTQFHPPIFN